MIWKVENKVTHKVDTWYSKELIDEILEEHIKPVLLADHCSNCDGCGYDNGCGDFECGTFQANLIWERLKDET